MNSKVPVVLVLVAAFALFISSEVAARNLAETSKEQTDVKKTTEAEVPKTPVIIPGPVVPVPCGRGKPYGPCIPAPPPPKCEPVYKRCSPPNPGEIIEGNP